MTEEFLANQKYMSFNSNFSDDVDLGQVAAALNRNKALIGCITLTATLLSSFYTITRKQVWEGSFQIVLEDQSIASGGGLAQLASSNPMLANLAGLGSRAGKSSLATEVKILESPSVLKPIYDFVKSNKADAGEDVSAWSYRDWVKGKLSIDLARGTSILNLSYRDTDKGLILPVLQRITKTYQEYSNRDKAKSINNALIFAKNQSILLKSKAKESNRKLDSYKLTYGLTDKADGVSLPKFRKLSSPFPKTAQSHDPLGELAAINKEITRRLQFFTESDPSVERLKQEREAMLQYINQTGGGLISIAGGGSEERNRKFFLTTKNYNAQQCAIAQLLLQWRVNSLPCRYRKPKNGNHGS